MYRIGDIIDGKYRVSGECDDTGGMGTILFVDSLFVPPPAYPIVLKFCKSVNPDHIARFKREVRLTARFAGNSKVVQLHDFNVDHTPPYFVMKYYAEGNLRTLSGALANNFALQEATFLAALDCVGELHSAGVLHRDLKPENFLLENGAPRVADLGLSYEVGSHTMFTTTTDYLGTAGYIPPEFLIGEFRDADPSSDIFMLARTMYVLLTNRAPAYLLRDGVNPSLYYVIEKASNLVKAARYQSIAEFRQAVVNVYDVLLGRAGGRLRERASVINDRFASQNQFRTEEVLEFVEELALAQPIEQLELIPDLHAGLYTALAQPPLLEALRSFLPIYQAYVDGAGYSFAHAEVIASRMALIFRTESVPAELRAVALRIAVHGAYHMNRFDAMDTCRALVRAVRDEELAQVILPVIAEPESAFLGTIEVVSCNSELVKNAIRALTVRR